MPGAVGDKIVVRGRNVGEARREAVILAVEGKDGPPYLVRWDDDDHDTLLYPGSDSLIEHLPVPAGKSAGKSAGKASSKASPKASSGASAKKAPKKK